MTVIDKAFGPLRDLPCWGVSPGYGGFLTFEFGEPHLEIREPIAAGPETTIRVRRSLARRNVTVHGEWHLWIYCCLWRVTDGERVIGDHSSPARLKRAASFLDGQKLVGVELAKRGARTLFTFDLGGELETKPYDRSSEQWMLREPSGMWLTWRADRRYSYELDSTQRGRWRKTAG